MIDHEYEILNAIDDGVLIINRDYGVVFANRSFLTLYQTTLKNIVGEKCYTVLHQCSAPCLEQCILEKIFKDGRPVSYEHHHLFADGKKRFYQISASPLKNKGGKVVRMLQLLKDITEQHQYKMALSTSHMELERIFNNAPFTISYLDRQMRIIRINPAMEKFIGIKTEEVKGKFCYDIRGRYAKDETRKYRERRCDSCRSQVSLQDGKHHIYERLVGDTCFEILSVPVLDQDNSIIGVMEIGNDITDRKHAEKALQKSKEEWERTFNSIPDIVTLQGTDLSIVKINQAGCDTLGLSHEEITGQHCYELFHGAGKPCNLCPLLETKKEFQPYSREMYHEKLNKTFLVSAAPVMDKHGSLEYIVHIAKDITEQKKLQQKSDQRLQQIIQADKLASLGEVVAGVAHEINNPNSFISYNIPLLEDIWQDLEPRVDRHGAVSRETGQAGISVNELCQDMGDIIEAIKVGSGRINQVVSNLKDFVRLDENSHLETIQLNEVIEKTYSIVGAQVRKSVSKITFHLTENLPPVKGHFQKFEQVMANLLINAAHAIHEKSRGEISISTQFIERLDSVVVTIEDNGVGMETEAISRIFEPFFTTRRDSGGTGLGLFVSYGLIREHAGTIGVLSRPGIGTRFTLFLPKDQQSDQLDLQPATLLVGKEENLSVLKDMLKGTKESRVFTFDGQNNIIPFLEEHPEVDIVLATMKNSHMHGWKLLEKIKKHCPLMAVILYAERGIDHIDNPTSFEPDLLLQKPFKAAQLLACIDSINRIRL